MIRREILKTPQAVLANFDWFNDYADTKQFLRKVILSTCDGVKLRRISQILEDLDTRFESHETKQLPTNSNRKATLLRAAFDMLRKQEIRDGETGDFTDWPVVYSHAWQDQYQLMEDIAVELEIDRYSEPLAPTEPQ